MAIQPAIDAVRVLRRDLRGDSSPVVVETAAGRYFVKLRGAAQGTSALVAEVVVAAIADRLGLPVPPRRVIVFPESIASDDKNDELADLLNASAGDNLGFQLLDGARPATAADLARIDPDFASQVVWLDGLVMNLDRTPENPNILIQGSRYWLIDHGASLPFQHRWENVTEQAPRRRMYGRPHALARIATRLPEWDPLLTALVTRDALTAAVAEAPDSFLRPLLPDPTSTEMLERRRAAYVAFLWKRLRGPRPFGGTDAVENESTSNAP